MKKQPDVLDTYCKKCPHFKQKCLLMEQVSPGKTLSQKCKVPIKSYIQSQVKKQWKGRPTKEELDYLLFDILHCFQHLSPNTFEANHAGARLVFALIRTLSWRRIALFHQEKHGQKHHTSSCRWYQGVQRTGSFCNRSGERVPLSEPKLCPKRTCFEPFREKPYEETDTEKHRDSPFPPTQHFLEMKQIERALIRFLELSPVLYRLFSSVFLKEQRFSVTKKNFSEEFKISVRSVELWKKKADCLFFTLYSGAADHLDRFEHAKWKVIALRDYNPKNPLPSNYLTYGRIASQLRLTRDETKSRHHHGWKNMQSFMLKQGYSQANSLSLPLKEKKNANG